jgi:hypothetical protein
MVCQLSQGNVLAQAQFIWFLSGATQYIDHWNDVVGSASFINFSNFFYNNSLSFTSARTIAS